MRPGALLLVFACLAGPVIAQDIQFGDNTGQYASDGLCDDRRFFGAGMAPVYNWTHAGTDAKDCQLAFRAGTVRLWSEAEAASATFCDAIRFGDDTSDYALNGICDDARFEGRGTDNILLPGDIRKDATDCQRLCNLGVIFLRDY